MEVSTSRTAPVAVVQKPYTDMKQDEAKILQGQHFSIKSAMGGLILAPIRFDGRPLRILDSGTGDGFWLLDLRKDLGGGSVREFVGTDITAARFPTDLPANVSMLTQSITDPWPTDMKESFDLVHQRLTLAGCRRFPVRDAVLNLCGLVKPGGWIQLVEPEQVAGPEDGRYMTRFLEMIREVIRCTGMDTSYALTLRDIVLQAGFEDVHERRVVQLLGALNPDPAVGEMGAASTGVAANHFTKLVKTLPEEMRTTITDAELDAIVPCLVEELMKKGGQYPLRVIWGRRP